MDGAGAGPDWSRTVLEPEDPVAAIDDTDDPGFVHMVSGDSLVPVSADVVACGIWWVTGIPRPGVGSPGL